MIGKKLFWFSVLLFVGVIGYVNCYKILGIIPTDGKSHYFVSHALMKGLAEKGHELTVISPFTTKGAIKNYRDVQTQSIPKLMKERVNTVVNLRDMNVLDILRYTYDMGIELTNAILAESSVKKLMTSGEKFDVVICEVFVMDALYGLAEHFNAPLIGVSTFGASKWATDLVGTPSPVSYVPNPFLPLTQKMTLLQRIHNLAVTTFDEIYFNNFYLPRQRQLFKQYFPKSKRGLDDIRKNTALVLLNSHVSQGFPRPYMPNMIEVGGMHINRKRKPLPADMQKFIDEAKHGVVYFSLGSNLKSNTLPTEKREAILQAFKSLKQRVLWKFEDPDLPGKSDNVFISDWFPQDDILAHPNVKLFITHGGLLGTMESVYHGKPFVGIPMFGDQFLNMARAEAGGYGIMVDYNKLTKEALSAAVNEMVNNPIYTNNMKSVSLRYRDQPLEPLQTAIYWVEYIARHKGAPHLHSAGQDLNFIQYHNLDAIIILFGGLLVLILLVTAGLYKLVSRFLGLSCKSKTTKKVKRN